ncbi:Pentatricopeptide repeat-containing protein [Raphanus sativus]|uniref:Pentatricopeptide repeat-containing protein At1g22830 n=1 Tax=Raphanus sativus TaxID=3726 RepID=A0A9W3DR27_RAPSA|nr:pentatricopeptide repeat-containing protein At1g22830 [Raphanus sativus]KAJ4916435.1 Pentatricopeptide repeat-containing protein [Raphanus sativus]
MPSSPYRCPTVTELRKFIPKSWKQPPRHRIILDETTPVPVVVLFKSLGRFISQGHLSEAFRTFSLLLLRHHQSGSHELVLQSAASLLSTCVAVNEFVPGQQIHARCISSGLEFDPVLVPKLVTFYSAFNLLHEARTVTESSGVSHPLPWNVLIGSYVRNKRFVEAVSAYKRMMSKGVQPDEFTYPSVLKACGALLDSSSGRVVHGSVEVSPHRRCLYVCNALISMYARFGDVDIARRLFDMMSERDAVSWNTLINCYASHGKWEEAIEFFDKMSLSGVEATVVTWNTLAGGFLQTGDHVKALSFVAKMRNHNVSLDSVAMVNGLKACSHIGAVRWGKEFHCLAIRSCYARIDNVGNSLITMYSRCGDLKHAFIVFQQMEGIDLSTWNSIISGYANNERSEEACFLLKEMMLSGFHPNHVTLASVLSLCARFANLQHGREVHCYILRHQSCFKDSLTLWNSLVDMYAKSGKVVASKRVFDLMSKRDKVTYTSLIDGYGMVGEGDVALAWFKEMIRSGMEPDHITMVAVLSACSHSGLVHEGERQFKKMQYVFGILPRLEHYSCMVDLYCRAGLLVTARDVIRRMPYEPSRAMCATLIIACLVHGNRDIGEWAADLLREMGAVNWGHCLLIADMYTASGSWSKLEEVKRLMSVRAAHDEFATLGSSSINQEQSSDEERLVEVG